MGPGRPLLGEQSNSSVIYGERAILKLFRRATAGLNPDLELHRALRRQHSARGRPAARGDRGRARRLRRRVPMTVAMLQDFASNSADGWSMALASVRDLLAEGDLRPDEVGGDFAGEAPRLGRPSASVHPSSPRRSAPPARRRRRARCRRLDARPSGPGRRGGPRGRRAPRGDHAGARRRQRGGRDRPAGAPHPRRPAPRPGAAHAARLAGHRLRGRAAAPAGRPRAPGLPAA